MVKKRANFNHLLWYIKGLYYNLATPLKKWREEHIMFSPFWNRFHWSCPHSSLVPPDCCVYLHELSAVYIFDCCCVNSPYVTRRWRYAKTNDGHIITKKKSCCLLMHSWTQSLIFYCQIETSGAAGSSADSQRLWNKVWEEETTAQSRRDTQTLITSYTFFAVRRLK